MHTIVNLKTESSNQIGATTMKSPKSESHNISQKGAPSAGPPGQLTDVSGLSNCNVSVSGEGISFSDNKQSNMGF